MYSVDFDDFAITMESYMISEYDIGMEAVDWKGMGNKAKTGITNAGKAIWKFILNIKDAIIKLVNKIIEFCKHPIQSLKNAGKWIKGEGREKDKGGSVSDSSGSGSSRSASSMRLPDKNSGRLALTARDDSERNGSIGGGGPRGPRGRVDTPRHRGGNLNETETRHRGGNLNETEDGTVEILVAGALPGSDRSRSTAHVSAKQNGKPRPNKFRDLDRGIVYGTTYDKEFIAKVKVLNMQKAAQAVYNAAVKDQYEIPDEIIRNMINELSAALNIPKNPNYDDALTELIKLSDVQQAAEICRDSVEILTQPNMESAPPEVQTKAKAICMTAQRAAVTIGKISMGDTDTE